MNLRDALLCVECDWIYSLASSCTRCGSRVSYPVARAMDHNLAAVARMEVQAVASRPAPALHLVGVESLDSRRTPLRGSLTSRPLAGERQALV